MTKITVVNIVGTASLGNVFDLNKITMSLDGAEYEPEQFPGLIYRIKEPKAAFLIFKSGKVVCTGTTSEKDAQRAVNTAAKRLREIDVEAFDKPVINIVNIVASADLGAELNLNQVAMHLGLENIEYEPEQFPGMVYRVKTPKVVILLFSTGKIICTGARVLPDVAKAVDILKKELASGDFL
ncbi:MAG: TATA-box-binding protein [Thermoplasmata archaeon]|nr:TATA-box-binding protein [Thermoplasmata archaeon]